MLKTGIFFHVAKTSGTSQIKIYENYDHIVTSNLYFNPKEILPPNTTQCFKWTFVRNPFDRLVSVMGAWKWKNINKTLMQLLDLAELGNTISWDLPVYDSTITSLDIWQNTDMAILSHLKPMHILISNLETKNITLDFIGKYEHLNISWKYIQKKMNINNNLPKLNKSIHKPYQSYFNRKKIVDRVIDIYKTDFEYFNYNTNPYIKS